MNTIQSRFLDLVIKNKYDLEDGLQESNRFFYDVLEIVLKTKLPTHDAGVPVYKDLPLVKTYVQPGVYEGNFSEITFNGLYITIMLKYTDFNPEIKEMLDIVSGYKKSEHFSTELWRYYKHWSNMLFGKLPECYQRFIVAKGNEILKSLIYIIETDHRSKVYLADTDVLVVENLNQSSLDLFRNVIDIELQAEQYNILALRRIKDYQLFREIV
jgi:hypothetical protein